MTSHSKIARALFATLALATAAACTQQPTASAPVASAASPELAGAWYEIYFDTNSTDIGDRGRTIVRNVAYVVANNSTTRVNVIGKTDRVGTQTANMILSQRRADTVRSALIAAGVPSARIDTRWTGETRQEVVTADDAADRRNRVVDITVVKMAN
jgi:peptidoglycan-associated lipoprotein